MDMATHYAIGINFQPLVFLAMPNTVQKKIAIFSSDKDIQPFNDGKCDKIQFLLIPDFVFATHDKLI